MQSYNFSKKVFLATLTAALFLVNFQALAGEDESRGIGFVLYHALTRNYERAGESSLFSCASSMEKLDLYSLQIFDDGRVQALTKTDRYGACTTTDTVESIVERHSCLKEDLNKKIEEAIELHLYTKKSLEELEQMGFLNFENPRAYETRVVIVSTNPDVNSITIRRRVISKFFNWFTTSSCPFKIEIRQSYNDRSSKNGQKKTRVYNP